MRQGTITRIDLKKMGNGAEFKRLCFEMDDGSWAKTDLCPTYRNWPRWRDLLAIGNELGELMMKDKSTVDADSHPVLIKRSPPPTQMKLL